MDKPLITPKPIRLLEIIGNTIVGGMETCVSRLLERLSPARFKIYCLCPHESSFTEQLRGYGCTVYSVPMPDEPVWRAIQFGCALTRAENIDVIHAHLPNAHLLAGMIGKLTDTPVLATIHGRDLSMNDLEMQRLSGTHIHVVSQASYYQALSTGIRADQISFIANGVDTSVFKPGLGSDRLHRLLGLNPATELIGFIGRLSPEKGPEVFIRSAALAAHGLPETHFVLIGEGPLRQRLETIVATLRMEERIHFSGLQSNLAELMGSLALVVSTSYSEGMPLALMEAQACGVPVVATQVGGVPDIVMADETGLLVSPGQTEAISQAIGELMRNLQRRRAMGQSAQRRMAEYFPLHERIGEMTELLALLAHGTLRHERRALSSVKSAGTVKQQGVPLQRAR